MTEASKDCRIDYIEFLAADITKTRLFYQEVFGREIRDHGPTYTTFRDGRLRGGFTTDLKVSANGALGL
jgi:predicted enzyme related to lactoylglutathione lyase